MHLKNIKYEVKTQLKKNYPGWKKLSKKQKKRIAKDVLDEFYKNYDFNQPIKNTKDELLGIDNQVIDKNIISLDEMEKIILQNKSDTLLKFINHNGRKPYLINSDLEFIDGLLDNQFIDRLLAYSGYSPA